MDNKTYVYIEPEKYLMDVLALLRSFYAEKDIKPVIPESREDVKAEAQKAGFFFSIRIMLRNFFIVRCRLVDYLNCHQSRRTSPLALSIQI